MRDRLIESRLTPNAISLSRPGAERGGRRAGHPAPVLPRRGGVHHRLDHGHARRSLSRARRQGDALRRLPRLHPGPDGGGHRPHHRRGLLRVARLWTSRWRRRVVAVLASLMVSYTRARAEALGVACKVGIATRPVRVVILGHRPGVRQGRRGWAISSSWHPAVYVLAALSVITVFQRIWHVRSELRRVTA